MALQNSRTIKGADYAREAVKLCAGNRNDDARKRLAMVATRIGNYDDAAKAVWQAYLDEGCPRG